jgi:hypothetical protein
MAMAKTTASNLPQILLAAARACRTGIIRFEQGSIKKQLVLRAGFVAFAESNSQEEHLARILTKLNLLTRKQLTEIAILMKAGKTVDEAILACSKLDTAGLEQGALEQSVTIMASIFGWSEYETHFYPGEGLIQRQMDLRLPLPELLVLAARRAISRRLVPRLSGRLQDSVWPVENRHGDLLTLPLNSAEALAFSIR